MNDVVILDGLDAAVIEQRGSRLVYSEEKIIDILMERDGMTREEAIEFIDYNIVGLVDGMRNGPIIED